MLREHNERGTGPPRDPWWIWVIAAVGAIIAACIAVDVIRGIVTGDWNW